jgi:hypothetical protein
MNNDFEKRFDEEFTTLKTRDWALHNEKWIKELKGFIRTERKAAYTQALKDILALEELQEESGQPFHPMLNIRNQKVKEIRAAIERLFR